MKTKSPSTSIPLAQRTFDARPDTVDFRDKMYVPTLVEVPIRIPLKTYLRRYRPGRAPILNQGQEGACTGFGLAAVAHSLLRRRQVVPDPTPVSPRMFYEMARRYDEWPGENYSGSSARGAMKGWHKHGVCAADLWRYDVNQPGGTLTNERALDAARRPLGAYFRVNHKDLVAMHSAMAEVGILYVTSQVHEGWGKIDPQTGVIPGPAGMAQLGGHAYALVGYDERGFWLQNSWGAEWGKGGFALITYEDWLANGTDVWVARLGAPVALPDSTGQGAQFTSLSSRAEYSFSDLRPHVISIGNDGFLRPSGQFGTTAAEVDAIFNEDLPRISQGWKKKRLLLYAHGGLVSEANALQRVDEYRKPLLDAEVYPLAFIWKTDFWTTVGNILKDALSRRKPEGFLDDVQDFMLDRLDDTLEPLARLPGKALWDEMKENALLSSTDPKGGARLILDQLAALLKADPSWEVHLVGHSAGSIFMAPLAQLLCSTGVIAEGPARGQKGHGHPIRSLTLWAPACTMKLFHQAYLPAIQNRSIQRFSLFTLKDAAEQDDHCAGVYHKSLLYLVSNAFEEKAGLFRAEGEPILGMERFILADKAFQVPKENKLRTGNPSTVPLFGLASAAWIRSPNGLPPGTSPDASHARRHGDFDDDEATVKSTLARILGAASTDMTIAFTSSASALRDRRRLL
jgi:hypothetical protein